MKDCSEQPRAESLIDASALSEALVKISQGLAETLGSGCEVVVHDLYNPATSVIHIENGHVTQRQAGDGIRDLAMILRSDRFKDDMLTNYVTRTHDGKMLKSMTVVIRNEQQHIIGAFCLNLDLGELLSAKAIIEDFTRGHELEPIGVQKHPQDANVAEIFRHIIRKTVDEASLPVSQMSRDDKVRIVEFLEEREVFLIKGAVEYVAETLSVSRYSIYNYLEEARSRRTHAGISSEQL